MDPAARTPRLTETLAKLDALVVEDELEQIRQENGSTGLYAPTLVWSESRIDDASLWNRYDEGRSTEAFYDPDADEFILVVDQPLGGNREPSSVGVFLSGGTAALALVVFLLTRRRSVASPEAPPPAGA